MADSAHSTRRAFLKTAVAVSALPIAGSADPVMAERRADIELPPIELLRRQIEATKEAMAKAYPDRDIHTYKTIVDGNATVIIMTEV